jgi:hypothetical protein
MHAANDMPHTADNARHRVSIQAGAWQEIIAPQTRWPD